MESSRAKNGVAVWIDDLMVYGEAFETFMETTRIFLDSCIRFGVPLSIYKSVFITNSPTWCGRTLTNHSWIYESKYFSKLLEMSEPKKLGEVEDLIYMSTWLAMGIPQLTEFKDRFQDMVTKFKKDLGKSTRRSRRTISIEDKWTSQDSEAFTAFKQRIVDSAKLALETYNPDCQLVLITDASKFYWAAVLGQEKEGNDAQSFKELNFRPLFFASGKFKGSAALWATGDKEMYPIIHTLKRFAFITADHRRPIKLFTDHLNLLYVIRPPKSVKLVCLGRVNRWGLDLQRFLLEVFHVEGASNTFADAMTRWGITILMRKDRNAKDEAAEIIGLEVMPNGDVRAGNVILKNAKHLITLMGLNAEFPAIKDAPRPLTPELVQVAVAKPKRKQKLFYANDPDWKKFKAERISCLHPSSSQDFCYPTIKKVIEQQEEELPKLDPKEVKDKLIKGQLGAYVKKEPMEQSKDAEKIWIPSTL